MQIECFQIDNVFFVWFWFYCHLVSRYPMLFRMPILVSCHKIWCSYVLKKSGFDIMDGGKFWCCVFFFEIINIPDFGFYLIIIEGEAVYSNICLYLYWCFMLWIYNCSFRCQFSIRKWRYWMANCSKFPWFSTKGWWGTQ